MTAPETLTQETPNDGLKANSASASPSEAMDAAEGGDSISDDLKEVFGKPLAEKDESSLSLVALRDVAIASTLLSIFGAAETWAAVSGLAFPALLSTINGFIVGAATCALAHEWGHFAGARLGGGHAPLKPIGGFLPLFDFDYKNNDKRSYNWMGLGGNIAHFTVPLIYFLALPMNSPGAAALVAGASGFAVFSGIIEIPVIRKSLAGMGSLESLGTIPKDFVSRTMPWAFGAAFLVFIVL